MSRSGTSHRSSSPSRAVYRGRAICCSSPAGLPSQSRFMVDSDRRPTAQEIEELIDLVRRDPGSPAFIDLGEAYLALGRPKDAISVGNVGIQASPDSLEGR